MVNQKDVSSHHSITGTCKNVVFQSNTYTSWAKLINGEIADQLDSTTNKIFLKCIEAVNISVRFALRGNL